MRLFIASLLTFALAPAAWAVPQQIPHQGRMWTATGDPLEGTHALAVRLYDAPNGGAIVWEETIDTDFSDGFYAIHLGATETNPVDEEALRNEGIWMSVAVDGGPELQRIRLTSVPYARLADSATHVQGGVVDATEIRVNGVVIVDSQGTFQGDFAPGGLGGLACAADEIAVSDGTAWGCAPLPVDTRVDEAQVDAWTENNGYAAATDLAAVATSGAFSDLSGVPTGLADGDNDTTYTAGAGLTLTGTQFAANQTTIGQWAVTAVTNSNNWLPRVDGTATRLTAASGLTVTGGANVAGGATLAGNLALTNGGIVVGNSNVIPRKMSFGRDDAYIISYTAPDGTVDRVNTAGATSGQLLVGPGGRIAYRQGTNTADSYLYFNLTGSSYHCTLLHAEDDAPRPGYYFATDAGNGYDDVWGNGSTPTFILRREGANLTASATLQAPIAQNASFYIMCF